MSKKLLLFLFEFGFLLKFRFVGELSVSELFLLISSVSLFADVKPFRVSLLRNLSYLYFLLLGIQLVASTFHPDNSFSNDFKGVAITVVSFLHVLFLYKNCRSDYRMLGYAFAGYAAYVITRWFMGDDVLESEHDQLSFLKFTFVPAFGAVAMLWLLYSKVNSRVKSLVYLLLGLLFITLGTRSSGSFFFVSGFSAILVTMYK